MGGAENSVAIPVLSLTDEDGQVVMNALGQQAALSRAMGSGMGRLSGTSMA